MGKPEVKEVTFESSWSSAQTEAEKLQKEHDAEGDDTKSSTSGTYTAEDARDLCKL